MTDPRPIGAYGIAEAAHYLALPPATLRTWVRGRTDPTAVGRQVSGALIQLPDEADSILSFTNLVETHVRRSASGAGPSHPRRPLPVRSSSPLSHGPRE